MGCVHPAAHRPFVRSLAPVRRGAAELWRVPLMIAALLVIEWGVTVGFYTTLYRAPPPFETFRLLEPLMLLAVIGVGCVSLWLLLGVLHARPFHTLLGPLDARWTRGLLLGALSAGAVFLAFETVARLTDEAPLYPNPTPPAAWALAAAIPIIAAQASAEELVFRGYLQQQLAARLKSPLIWAVAPSILFGAAHYHETLGPARGWADAIAAGVTGLIWAYATWRTGSLGFAIGAHVMNNWVAILLVGEAQHPTAPLAIWMFDPGSAADVLIGEAIWVVVTLVILEGPGRRFLGLPRLRPLPNKAWGRISPSETE